MAFYCLLGHGCSSVFFNYALISNNQFLQFLKIAKYGLGVIFFLIIIFIANALCTGNAF